MNEPSMFDTYSKVFRKANPSRNIYLIPDQGLVDVKIEFKSETVDLRITPVHLTLLTYFDEQGTLLFYLCE